MTKRISLFGAEGERKYLSWPEREAFFQTIETCPEPAHQAFCLTLFYTGCRISEALELCGERVDFSERAVIFRTLKRSDNHYRIIPIPQKLLGLLDDLVLTKTTFKEPLWTFSRPTGYRLIKKHMAIAGIHGIKACPKGLRHSFAVAYACRNVPVTTVQRWMGHKRLDTTAIYLDMMGEEDRKQAAKIWNTS